MPLGTPGQLGAGDTVQRVDEGSDRLDPARVIEADTQLGPLLVERDAEVVTRSLLEVGYWDPSISGLMQRVLRPGMTFVDAGANIGWFSVLGSRLVGQQGRVFAVEPDQLNLQILRANLERHGCSNVTVLPIAAWSERTKLDFARPPEEGAVGRVGQKGTGEVVQADRLDDLISGPVDYLKIDCELSDHVVVQGADGLMKKSPSMLVSVEFHPWHESHLGTKPSQVLDTYRRMDLRPYEIGHRGLTPTTWERLASPQLEQGHIAFDFALSRCEPAVLRAKGLMGGKGLLERAGDLLEHVPEPIRPRIRHRDRRSRHVS
jgi:FkbM family methyltransferase